MEVFIGVPPKSSSIYRLGFSTIINHPASLGYPHDELETHIHHIFTIYSPCINHILTISQAILGTPILGTNSRKNHETTPSSSTDFDPHFSTRSENRRGSRKGLIPGYLPRRLGRPGVRPVSRSHHLLGGKTNGMNP